MGGRRTRPPGEELEMALIHAAHAGSMAEIAERALPHLRRAVGADHSLLYRYDGEGRLIGLGGELSEQMGSYSHHYLHLDPVHRFPRRLAPQPRVVLATHHVDRRDYRRSAAYGEFYATHEMEHLVCTWLTHRPYASPGMAGMLFTRPPGSPDFGEPERRLLLRALPALVAAAARAERLRELDRTREVLEAILAASSPKPRLVLTSRGDVVWASATAERLLQAARPGRFATLRAAAARVERTRKAIDLPPGLDDASGFGAHLSLLPSASGPMVLVELDPRAPAPADDDLQRRFGITRAEALVLAELSAGLGNPAIAARLHLSIETVRTHVARILGKLGVHSRVEAALLVARSQ